MRELTVGADTHLVSDEIAHHVTSYYQLLSVLGRETEVTIPTAEGEVTLQLGRGTPLPTATDRPDVPAPDDPDDLTGLLESEVLTMLHDMGELYEAFSTDWQAYTRERR